MGWQDAPIVDSGKVPAWQSAPEVSPKESKFERALASFDKAGQKGVNDVALGALKGASDIGATLLRPVDAVLNATGVTDMTNVERRAKLKEFFAENADPSSYAFKGGELAADVAGTAGVGGVLAKGARAIPVVAQYAPRLAAALESGGFKLGGPAAVTTGEKVASAALRATGGAATGGASAGLVNPADTGTGAVLGGALPGAVKLAGTAGQAIAGKVEPEVAALYQKAKKLGIDIPVDRIVNSKPLNALAASLNYVPLSGRAATEETMVSQMNRALSRTFGQDSDNVTAALRKASDSLGQKFETTLKGNTVKADNELLNDLASNIDKANRELGADGAKIIGNQAEEIMSKIGANGEIDGQAAYNIKKALDRIGDRNSSEAFYAREMKKSLMGALNRSLGPQEAANFATVRKQYGNMLDLENLAQNGAEGGVSVGRLANLKNINNKDLQDIADIAAQFVKTRENPHGAMQRVMLGGIGAGAGVAAHATIPVIAGGIVAGRGANMALNSNTLKRMVLDPAASSSRLEELAGTPTRSLLYSLVNRANP